MMSLQENLRWRYAVKKFDPERVVDEAHVEAILEAGNLSASSYGLQPYRFVVIRDQELQERLVTSSYGQRQVADASHVILIAIRTDVDDQYIANYTNMVEENRDIPTGSLDQYRDVMIGAIGGMSDQRRENWAIRQTYIALGSMMAACAALEVDSCPMEGFIPNEYDDILKLADRKLHASLVLPIGYRSPDDPNQHLKKVRKPLDEMVVRIEG